MFLLLQVHIENKESAFLPKSSGHKGLELRAGVGGGEPGALKQHFHA